MSECIITGLYVTLYNQYVKPFLLYESEVLSVDYLLINLEFIKWKTDMTYSFPEKKNSYAFKMLWVFIYIQ